MIQRRHIPIIAASLISLAGGGLAGRYIIPAQPQPSLFGSGCQPGDRIYPPASAPAEVHKCYAAAWDNYILALLKCDGNAACCALARQTYEATLPECWPSNP